MGLLQSPALPLGYPAITARELDDTRSSGARRDFLPSIHAGHPEPEPCSRIGRPGWIFFRKAFVVCSLRIGLFEMRLAHSSACERICCAVTSLPTAGFRLSMLMKQRRGKGCEDWSDSLLVVCLSQLPTTLRCTAVSGSRHDPAREPDGRLPTVCCFPIAPSHPRASSDRTSPLRSRTGVRMRRFRDPPRPPPCSARSEVRAFQSTYSR